MNFNFLYTKNHLSQHLADPHRNNFGLIRLIAALLVMETHSHLLSGENLDDYYASFHASFLGLPSFFFLSGLLVTQSLFKSSSWKNFLWRRLLRIYPAPWLAILLSAFILGPLVTTLPLHAYFTSPILYHYLVTCSLIHINFLLPGVFTHSVLGTDSVNASLWTISLELKLYVGLLLAWWLRRLLAQRSSTNLPGKKLFFLLLLLLLIILSLVGPYTSFINPYAIQFGIGALCYLYKDSIVSRGYWLFLLPLAFFISNRLNILPYTAYLLIPALVIFAATHGAAWLQKITPKADLSYGIYVFAFPVQQLVANYLHPANPLILFVSSVIAVLPLAILSWYGVEKRALRLKTRVR